MKNSDRILALLKKKKTLTFEEIADEFMLDHKLFMNLITDMQNDNLIIIDDRKEIVSLNKI